MCSSCTCVGPTTWHWPHGRNGLLLLICYLNSKKLSSTGEPKPLHWRGETVQTQSWSSMKLVSHVSMNNYPHRILMRDLNLSNWITCFLCSHSLCDGCDQQTELVWTNTHPSTGLASCTEWQGYGRHCTDWLWENACCKNHVLPLTLSTLIVLVMPFNTSNLESMGQWSTWLLCDRCHTCWSHKSKAIISFDLQYLLPAIVHINHQPFLERGDGPIVSDFEML